MVVSYKVLREQVAKKLSGLQSENAKLQAGVAMWRANARAEAEVCLKLGAENAQLQVVVRAIANGDEPPEGWLELIKEVDDE